MKLLRFLFKKVLEKNLTTIVWYITFKCNYKCPYCIIKTKAKYYKKPFSKEIGVREWIKIFQKFPPSIVRITGGEPTLFEDFSELANKFPKKHILCITTNLSNIDELKKIKRRFIFLSTSYHPYMTKIEDFISKAIRLRKKFFSLTAECVAYPHILNDIVKMKEIFSKHDIKLNVDPYIDPEYSYTEDELKKIKKLSVGESIRIRAYGFDFQGYGKIKICNAGSNYFVIIPNGDVYTCNAGFYYVTSPIHKKFRAKKSEFYLGNLFDNTFSRLKEEKICYYPCSEACDIETAKPKLLNRNF